MPDSFIPQVEPWVTPASRAAVSAYLDSGGWLTEFTETRSFEEEIGRYVGAPHAVVVTSGTVAIYLALLASGIGPGDRVLVPAYTMAGTYTAVAWCGAQPILVDVLPDHLCLDLKAVRNADGIKAMIYVPMNGRCGDMEEIVRFCNTNGILLIEDAAQAMGSRWKERYLGTYGEAGVYSFTPHKIISTGQGGVVVTANQALQAKARKLKDFHRKAPGVDVHDGVGFNFKFTDLQAALGRSQLGEMAERSRRKKALFAAYAARLENVPGMTMLATDLEACLPWFVDVILPSQRIRDSLSDELRRNGIGSRPFYSPLSTQPPFKDSALWPCPVAEDIAPRGLWLPSSLTLEQDQIGKICKVIRDFLQR